MFRCYAIITAIVIILNANIVVAQTYNEDFTTTAFKDAVQTTAEWDTVAAELGLPDFTLTLRGTYNTTGSAFGVVVDGDMAFVADQLSGLQVIDITDLTAPVLLGTYNTTGSALGIAKAGKLVFVADSGSGLQIIDVSNPSSPTLVGTYNTPGFATAVAISGDHAFVADYSGGLEIINISNPAIPTLAGNLSTPGNANGIAVDGDYAFIADDSFGLRIIDVTDPTNPVSIGFYNTAVSALGVAVDGDYAFVADGGALLVFDITDPTNPLLIGSYISPGNARSVAVTGDRAFLADYSSGLQVIDITDPTNPTLVHGYDTTGQARSVVVDGTHAFIAGATSGLQIIETSQVSTAPQLVGSAVSPGNPNGIAIAGNYAFVASSFGTSGFEVFDISDPANPTVVGSHDTPHAPLEVVVAGDYAYVVDGTSVITFDISDPANPDSVGSYVPADFAGALAVDGNLALIGSWGVSFELVDVSDPTTLTYISTHNVGGSPTGAVISGDYAFITRYSSGLCVVDISDPANPVTVGTVATPGNAIDVAVAGNYAFVADEENGLQVVDISDPTNPVLAGSYDTLGLARTVRVAGDYAFVAEISANGLDGLRVIDISDPNNPTLVGSYTTPSFCLGLAVAGNHAFLVGSIFDLHVVEVFQEQLDTRNNIGRSLALNTGSGTVVRARVSPTQTGTVAWELTANGGTDFESFSPNAWTEFANAGTDLRWRSTHNWAPGVNPTVSNLTVNWLYEFASVTSITDVPNDQGKQVSVEWTRSGHDFVGDPLQIVEYAVYRQIDPDLTMATVSPTARSFEHLSPVARENALMMAGAGWHFVATVPVLTEDSYAVVVPTLADSTIVAGDYQTTFRITALTATPGVFFHSPPDSGYSSDNLSPSIPASFSIAYNTGSGNTLSWDEAPEVDFQYFRVYRSTDPNFDPTPGDLVHSTTSPSWIDPDNDGGAVFYKVTATDFSGNESDAASVSVITAVPDVDSARFVLHTAAPNPFNPSTRLSFELASTGTARLDVFDVKGRRVITLVNEIRVAGRHEVIWRGTNAAGKPVTSGVYFYRLKAGGNVQIRRMTLVK